MRNDIAATDRFPWDANSAEVLRLADALDPGDDSREARHLREVAQSVREHRDCNPLN